MNQKLPPPIFGLSHSEDFKLATDFLLRALGVKLKTTASSAEPHVLIPHELSISYDFWQHASIARPEPTLFLADRYAVPPKEKKLPRKAKKAFIKSFGRSVYRARYRKNYKESDAQKGQKYDDNIFSMCL